MAERQEEETPSGSQQGRPSLSSDRAVSFQEPPRLPRTQTESSFPASSDSITLPGQIVPQMDDSLTGSPVPVPARAKKRKSKLSRSPAPGSDSALATPAFPAEGTPDDVLWAGASVPPLPDVLSPNPAGTFSAISGFMKTQVSRGSLGEGSEVSSAAALAMKASFKKSALKGQLTKHDEPKFNPVMSTGGGTPLWVLGLYLAVTVGSFVLFRLANTQYQEVVSDNLDSSTLQAASVVTSAGVYAGLSALTTAIGNLEAALTTGSYASRLDYEKLNEIFSSAFLGYDELQSVEIGFKTATETLRIRKKAADVCSANNRLGISIVSSDAACGIEEACSLGVTCEIPGEDFRTSAWFQDGLAALTADFGSVRKVYVGPSLTVAQSGALVQNFALSLAMAFDAQEGLIARAVISSLELSNYLTMSPASSLVLTDDGEIVATNVQEYQVSSSSGDSLEFPVVWSSSLPWQPPQPLAEGLSESNGWHVLTERLAEQQLWTSCAVDISSEEELSRFLFLGTVVSGSVAATFLLWVLIRLALLVRNVDILPDWMLNIRDWMRGY